MTTIRVLMVGDIVGETGQAVFAKHIKTIRDQYSIDAVVVNGENSAPKGRGITPRVVNFFKEQGVNLITSGNHVWYNKDIYPYLEENTNLLRPANYPSGAPGKGIATFMVNGTTIGVMNLQGRVFMKEHVDCPFRTADSLLPVLSSRTKIILVDFHAEATSEKHALAYELEGKVSAVVGTHTHVQTADERILPGGTAYISDLGMCGSLNSMIGMKKEAIIANFRTQLPTQFSVESTPPFVLCGVVITIDVATGKAISIQRIRLIDNNTII